MSSDQWKFIKTMDIFLDRGVPKSWRYDIIFNMSSSDDKEFIFTGFCLRNPPVAGRFGIEQIDDDNVCKIMCYDDILVARLKFAETFFISHMAVCIARAVSYVSFLSESLHPPPNNSRLRYG